MSNFVQTLRNIGLGRALLLAVLTAGLIGFFAFLGMRLTAPSLGMLYTNLDVADSGSIVSKLEAMKVPYKLAANGTQINVPEDQVLRIRMQLAQDGLPSGGSVGYEIFDRSSALGATSFLQNLNEVRALEGELARTIRTIDGVLSARVHLVMPKRELFSRENREASAAIAIKARGVRLDAAQVRGIQNLVAASVPDLKPSRISVLDDRGNLLGGGMDDRNPNAAAAGTLADARMMFEERTKKAVEALLERSVGAGNVRAEVTADMDFDRITTNSESYDPDGQVIRSTQTTTENSQNADGSQAGTVSVGTNLPEASAAAGGGGSSQSKSTREEALTNYEISKTVRTQVKEAGNVRRLSVAVLVNGNNVADADGKKTYTPRTEAELQQLNTLVKSAIGFDQKRGDTVEVVNLQFAEGEDLPVTAEAGGFLGLNKADYFRIGESVAMLLLAVLALVFVRPLVARILAGRPGAPTMRALPGGQLALTGPDGLPVLNAELPGAGTAPAPGIESMIDIARIEGQVKASSVKKIGEIVEKHPDETVAIVRSWLYQDA